jgi:hypothetical protein
VIEFSLFKLYSWMEGIAFPFMSEISSNPPSVLIKEGIFSE